MATSGDGIVPRIAGVPWLNDPPLYHWLAVASGKLLQFFLEFHSGARLASGFLVLGAFYLIYLAARDWQPDAQKREAGSAALLLLLGSLGLMVHAHEALPELAALAALCGALAVLPHAASRPLVAGVLFGAALGFAFLAASWIAPLALGLAVLAAHLVCDEWRRRGALLFVVCFVVVALLVACVLAARAARALAGAVRAVVGARLAAAGRLRRQPALLPEDRRLVHLAGLAARAVGALVAAPAPHRAAPVRAVRRLGRDARRHRLLGPAAGRQPDHAARPARAARRAGRAGPAPRRRRRARLVRRARLRLLHLPDLARLLRRCSSGMPPRMANNFFKTAPGFVLEFRLAAGPGGARAARRLAVRHVPLHPLAGAQPGALGRRHRPAVGQRSPCCWMPWADYQRSYRSVALQLRSKIPVDAGCIAQRSLGISQAAVLDYHAGIRTRPFDALPPSGCTLLIVQGSPKSEFDGPGPDWEKLADVGRPGDKSERYRLYRQRRNEYHLAARLQGLAPAAAPRRELARGATEGPVRERRRAQHAVRRRGARHPLRLLPATPRRHDAAPARQPRRRARPARMARCAALRQGDQHEREAPGVAHGAERWLPYGGPPDA